MTLSLTAEDLHQALLSLYSPTVLASSVLAERLPEAQQVDDPVARAQVVRSVLLDAVEALRPAGRTSPSASASRAYDCLTYRYVSGLTVDEVAYELHLSQRQVYRDLRWGEERLTELLQARLLEVAPKAAAMPADTLSEELQTVTRRPEWVDLAEVCTGCVAALATLAKRFGSHTNYTGPASGVLVTATPGLLRQVVTQVLSAVLQGSPGSQIDISLTSAATSVTLGLAVRGRHDLLKQGLMRTAIQVLEAQAIDYRFESGRSRSGLYLTFPASLGLTVLIVEDNPSTRSLYERYLENTEWKPVILNRPGEAPQVAAARNAAAIILDIMMPDTDGWSVLQALRLNRGTHSTPVIVCSVLSDPELGAALGASAYLTKPVSRPQLLQALRRATRERSPAAGT
ncbi:MAG: response regulator [Anaerolineae bacterium]